jgi:DNA-binding transcriptional LysR family regulator
VTVRLTLNDRVVDLVDEGYDCVFRVGALADSTLIARRLRPVELVACASPAYLARRGAPRHPTDLAGHECLGFAGWELERCWRFVGPGGEIAVAVTSRFSANIGEALRQAALSGWGIVLQARELTAEDVAAGRLVRVLPEWDPPRRPMHLLFAPDRGSGPSSSLRRSGSANNVRSCRASAFVTRPTQVSRASCASCSSRSSSTGRR